MVKASRTSDCPEDSHDGQKNKRSFINIRVFQLRVRSYRYAVCFYIYPLVKPYLAGDRLVILVPLIIKAFLNTSYAAAQN